MLPHRSNSETGVTPALSRCDWILLGIARSVVLLSLIYATWHYGGVEAAPLYRLCWLVAVGLVATLGLRPLWSRRLHPLPSFFFALMLAWVFYALLQLTPTISPLKPWFSRAHGQAARFLDGSDELKNAASALVAEDSTTSANRLPDALPWGTAIPEATLQASVPYTLALALAVLTSISFQTDRSRVWLLWGIVVNATAVSTWGILQRAGGGSQILPGVENLSGGVPFSSFIYKNAGAAALLPAIAALVALALMKKPGRASGVYWRSNSSNRSQWTDQLQTLRTLTLLFLGGILATGLIASLSRGAWFAGLVSVLGIAALTGMSLRDRRTWIGAAGLAGLLVAVAVSTGIIRDIQTRAGQVSVDSMTADQRWGQWMDGFRAAVANFPSGSGLGTYGYASLPFQSQPRSHWFRDAHNQYLEVFAEMGLVGLVILAAGIAWFARLSYQLFKAGRSAARGRGKNSCSQRQCWGMIGIALLMCGAIQSSFDFVLKIPANLLLYSVLIAAIAVTRRSATAVTSSSSKSPYSSGGQLPGSAIGCTSWPQRIIGHGATWVIVSMVLLVLAGTWTNRRLIGERALVAATLVDPAENVSAEHLNSVVAELDTAIEVQPLQSSLYYRRAMLGLTQYRQAVLEVAKEQDVNVRFADTRLDVIGALLTSLPPDQRQVVRGEFLSQHRLRTALARSLRDFRSALLLNPYHTHTHLRCAMLAPLADLSDHRWLAHSAALGNNSEKILFDNGLIAYHNGDLEMMLDQWSKTLLISQAQLPTILELAIKKASLLTVVERLVPANRSDQIVALLKRNRDASSDRIDPAEVEAVIEFIERSDDYDEARRHGTLASLNDLLGRDVKAIEHWQQALLLQPLEPGIRLSLAAALRRAGRIDEALNQAVLGKSLFSRDDRFEQLTAAIRRDIRNRR